MSLQDRPYAKSYSGLINQAYAAAVVSVLAFGGQELLKRARRGRVPKGGGLGSVESWGFGYLYQGRSWARNPSPPSPQGWPLSWVKQVTLFPEEKLNELRGVDAAFYARFLRGCSYWTLAQTVIVFPILFPIHYVYSTNEVDYAKTSLLRGDISSLVQPGANTEGRHLFWVHLILIYFVTFSWMFNIYWIIQGTLRYRAQRIAAAAAQTASADATEKAAQYHPHPHPQFHFEALPALDHDGWNRGLRHRTVMVTNVPLGLRSERELRAYFEYYLARPVDVPALGLPPSVAPGLLNKLVAFVYNRARRSRNRLSPRLLQTSKSSQLDKEVEQAGAPREEEPLHEHPQIDRVVIVRKMSELATLLHRREEVLVKLEAAHIQLARRALAAVRKELHGHTVPRAGADIFLRRMRGDGAPAIHVEEASDADECGRSPKHGEGRMDLLVRVLGPFAAQMEPYTSSPRHPLLPKEDPEHSSGHAHGEEHKTIWDALLSLPRSTLDGFQPLMHLRRLWRGNTVPEIDYYAAKLALLNSLILELRARDATHVPPASTAFVTFREPAGARRACKYLAAHPTNPLSCLVTMAPCFEDLDWGRLMKTTYRAEVVKDWVVGLGVWAFTIFWLIPVSALLSLIDLQNFKKVWPAVAHYFDKHTRMATLISSFLPTLLVSVLTILVPLILLLVAKKAHTIVTLSELHDRIMTRYYKFLILNLLVFFCIGSVFLVGFFTKFHDATNPTKVITAIQTAFPTAGPFYVGWLIFTTAIHGGFEIVLFGLPLLVYPKTRSQITPRKRSVGIRPRTLNYYYWLPNHLLVIHILLVFAILNPLVLPFGLLYFSVARTVIKNQLLHVYAKHYEGNAKLLIIRLIRYSFDGLMLAQVVFIAFMALAGYTVNIVLGSVLLAFTVFAKLTATRLCRSRFEQDDIAEANAICGDAPLDAPVSRPGTPDAPPLDVPEVEDTQLHPNFWTWRFPSKMHFGQGTLPGRHPAAAARRQPIPFGSGRQPFTRLRSMEMPREGVQPDMRAAASMPALHPDAMTSLGSGITPPPPPMPSIAEPMSPEPKAPREMVTQHAPHPAWDDESSPNQPYENPYLTRDIENVLWLPRDPCGLLDLDDTVNMHRCLTSTPGLGDLSHADEDGEEDDLGILSLISSNDSEDGEADEGKASGARRLAEGAPFVESPDTILVYSPLSLTGTPVERDPSPARSAHLEPDGLQRRRHTPRALSVDGARHRRISGMSGSSPRHANGVLPGQPSTGYRSFSGGSRMSRRSGRAPSSFLSGSEHNPNGRPLTDDEADFRPPFRSQTSFTRSTLSVVHASAASDAASSMHRSTRQALSEHARHMTAHTHASAAHEVVIEEVIAEEREAAEQREAQEEAQEARAAQRPPWWKAWAFASAEPEGESTPLHGDV